MGLTQAANRPRTGRAEFSKYAGGRGVKIPKWPGAGWAGGAGGAAGTLPRKFNKVFFCPGPGGCAAGAPVALPWPCGWPIGIPPTRKSIELSQVPASGSTKVPTFYRRASCSTLSFPFFNSLPFQRSWGKGLSFFWRKLRISSFCFYFHMVNKILRISSFCFYFHFFL